MTDTELEALLFRDGGRNKSATRAAIDYPHVHQEMHRQGVTLQLLWSEYFSTHHATVLPARVTWTSSLMPPSSSSTPPTRKAHQVTGRVSVDADRSC